MARRKGRRKGRRNRKGQFTSKSNPPRRRAGRRRGRSRRRGSLAYSNPPRRRGSRRAALMKSKLLSKNTAAVAGGGLAGFAGVGAVAAAVARKYEPAKGGWTRVAVKAATTGALAWAANKFTPRPYNKPLALGIIGGGGANTLADAIGVVTKKAQKAQLNGFTRSIEGDNGDDIGMLGNYSNAQDIEDAEVGAFTDAARVSTVNRERLVESPNFAAGSNY